MRNTDRWTDYALLAWATAAMFLRGSIDPNSPLQIVFILAYYFFAIALLERVKKGK